MSLSTTAINDRLHRTVLQVNCQNSSETTSGLQIRLNHGLPRLGRDVGDLSQAPSKTQSPNSKKRWWSGTACHRYRSTRLLKASHSDWWDAQKLTVNNPNTQSVCQTFRHHSKIPLFKRKTLCCYSDFVPCALFQNLPHRTSSRFAVFRRKRFQRAIIAKW